MSSDINPARVREMLDAATPGPWKFDETTLDVTTSAPGVDWDIACVNDSNRPSEEIWCSRCMTMGCRTEERPPFARSDAALICAAPDIARAYLDARAEADALRAEVERLQTNPLATMLHRIPATEAPFELVYHPSDVGAPGWTCVVAGYVNYGTLDAVIAAACDRLGVDHD